MRIMMRDFVFIALLFSLLVVLGVVFSDGGLGDIAGEAIAPVALDVSGESSSVADLDAPEKQDKEFRTELRKILQMTSGIIEQRTSDLPDMLKTKKIRILTTYTFGNYFVHQGQARGFEYSKMEEFRKFLTRGQSQKDLQVVFSYFPLPYDMLIEALNLGYGDIVAASLTITPDRSQDVDFTDPYLWGIKEVLVSKKGIKGTHKLEDLSGKQIHVRKDSSYHISLKKINQQFNAKNLDPIQIETLPGLINTSEIMEMVNAGIIDFTISDTHLASLAGELLPDIQIHDNIVFNPDVQFGWMVRKNNPELKASLNQFLSTVKKGTLLGNVYYKRYFKENPWVREAMHAADFDSLNQYAVLFKKYGEMYDMDWLMLASQAFQESRFDPKAWSSSGAQGLMQLLPSTAKDMGFNDIRKPEDNVHAGAKYLRWIMDRYFPGEEITEDDRLRFALAAYNAGPANIRRSRSITANMGYDENQWFSHTEIGTMRQVGLEPVHYVRNINRYCLAFTLSTAIQEAKKTAIKN